MLLSAYLICILYPTTRYIRLNYAAHETIDSFRSDLNRLLSNADENLHFIEGLILSPHKYVLMTGSMTDRGGGDETVNRIGRWYKPWFYKHVDQLCFGRPGNLKGKVDFILEEYFKQNLNRLL